MKMKAYIAGVGMTHFGKHMDTGLKALGGEAILQALSDAGSDKDDVRLVIHADTPGSLENYLQEAA